MYIYTFKGKSNLTMFENSFETTVLVSDQILGQLLFQKCLYVITSKVVSFRTYSIITVKSGQISPRIGAKATKNKMPNCNCEVNVITMRFKTNFRSRFLNFIFIYTLYHVIFQLNQLKFFSSLQN